jgi:hypothetical protein
MTKYKWLCACGIWIESDTELQLNKAKLRHYTKHKNEGLVMD